MAMTWLDLLFAHWRVDPSALRPLIPAGLDLDLRDGAAWVGVVPFRMTGVRLRYTPALPGPGAFPELNVRTYVSRGGRPGVWFLSLDAASRIAVRAARTWFHLPYFDAEMSCERRGDEVRYASRRTHRGAPCGEFRADYGPAGPAFRAAPGSLEHWLCERYSLYAAKPDGTILRGDIRHEPWTLRPARSAIEANSMCAADGLPLPAGASPLAPEHLLFAEPLGVVAWSPRPA